jgi:hypothetical protein
MGDPMPTGWSREEVEATVADYFDMLQKELAGIAYSKSEHRRRLSSLVNARSDAAIERKHQNISAILISGFPYITGYKPLGNYQHLLYEVVTSRLANNHELSGIVQKQVIQPAILPTIDDILASLVSPPKPVATASRDAVPSIREPLTPYRVNYLEQEAANESLGSAGEEYVLRFEKARLVRAGQERLASRIEHVSKNRGDSAGYDILSFEETGQERLIEVKTTAYGQCTPFFVTRHELETSLKTADRYYLYRPHQFRHEPKLFVKAGPLDRSFSLDPSQFLARVA